MYYYIAEPVTAQAERRRVDEIKTMLSQLGIAGEFAIASPARTVEEHLELAFSKGFTTIVGIGSDALITQVAANMIGRKYDKGVLGAIPFQSNQAISQMIGVTGLSAIAEALRARRTMLIDAVQLGAREAIITEASIQLSEPTEFHLRYGAVLAQGMFTNMTVQPSGEVKIWSNAANRSTNLFSQLFRSSSAAPDTSLTSLVLQRWDFATKVPCSLMVGGKIIAETPFEAIYREKALKLIVNRATITPVKEHNG